MAQVKNSSGKLIDFDAAVQYMDDELREELHGGGYETEQAFFTAYEKAHDTKYGEAWFLSEPNPVW